MSQQAVLQWAIGGLAVLVAAGLLYFWRRAARVDATKPQVRVLGLYSPILTWLRYARLPSSAAPAAVPAGRPERPAAAFFASETSQAGAGAPQPAAGGPASSSSSAPSLWDQLQHGWTTLPDRLQGWARANLKPGALQRSWSGVLLHPAQETAPVGIRVAWRDLALEWLLVGLVVTSFCAVFLKFGSTSILPGNEAQVFQMPGWVLLNGLKNATFPLWNPYMRSGLPFVGDPMLSIFNPLVSVPILLAGVLDGYKIALLLSFLAAAWGMWYLGKVLGFSRPARMWAALFFALCGPAVGRFYQGHYLFVFGFAWIPWALAGLLAALRTHRRRHTAIAIGALALLFLSGNVYYAYYMLVVLVLMAPALVLSWRPVWRVNWQRVQVLAVIGIVALGLIALQLLPLAGMWPRLSKAVNLQLTDSQTFKQVLLDFTSPDSNRPDAAASLTREEFYGYIGWWPFMALALLPLALWKRERRPLILFGLMILVVFVWIDLRDMPWRDLYLKVPLLYEFRYPTRMLVYGACALIALAGLALDTLWLLVWPAARTLLLPETAPARAGAGSVAVRAAAVGVAGLLLAFMVWSVNDLYQTNQKALQPTDAFPASGQVASWLRAHDLTNYYVGDLSDWHQAWLSNGLHYLNAWYAFDDIRRTDGQINIRQVEARPKYWVLSNDHAPTPDMGADPTVVQQMDGYTIYQLPHNLPYAFLATDQALQAQDQGELRSDDVSPLVAFAPNPNQIEMIADGSSRQTVVTLAISYPGWRLTIDGHSASIENVGGYLAAAALPGVHQYLFSYQPISFYVGLLISLLCLLLTGYWLLSDLPFRLAEVRASLRAPRHWPAWQQLNQRLAGGAGPWTIHVLGVRLEISRVNVKPVETVATLGGVLFALSLGIYAFTRLYALDRFPIYFFADETANPLFALQLIAHGFRDAAGNWFPVYFDAAANRWTPLLSVYIHALPLLLFGKSLLVTRATSSLFSLFGALAVALIFKDVFKQRFWWIGALLLGLVPAWFLHSRTAFETVIMVSFFACFLLCYMLYRTRSPRYLYGALLLGAAAFYTYSNGQSLMAAMGGLLLISDWRYHWAQRRVLARGLLLGLLLALPLVLFRLQHPNAFGDTLHAIDSFLTQNIPTGQKIQLIAQTYLYGLSPQYLFFPNDHDLPRHTMLGYGHMGLALLPLVLVGLLVCLRQLRSSPHRAVLLSALAAPVGASLVGVGITRVLPLVITTALLAGLGLNAILSWISSRLEKWRPASAIPFALISLATFAVLAWASIGMLQDALANGPLWFRDYGLYGMQYGAQQLFGEAVPAELAADPNVKVMVSSTWANGTDEFTAFFLTPAQQARVLIRDIDYYTSNQNDLSNTVLVMTPGEYQAAVKDLKFSSVQVERVLPYPDGTPGFYFARLTYSDQAAAIFGAEEAARRQPVTDTIQLDGQTVTAIHSRFDAGGLPDIFDGDTFTLVRGKEANPLVIELHFPTPRTLGGLGLDLGSMDSFSVTALVAGAGDQAPAPVFSQSYKAQPPDPHLTIGFANGQQPVSVLRLEIKNLESGDTAQIHVREIALH